MLVLQDAIDYVRGIQFHRETFNEAKYHEALESIVDQRASLTYPIYINLPGGLSGNSDSKWDKVKAGSEERCSCGNERVIRPGNPRTTYEPSETGSVVISSNKVYLRSVGGDKASVYVMLAIEQEALTFLQEPFAPFVLTPDLFSTRGPRGYKLAQLAEILPKQKEPPIFVEGKTKMKIFAINAVDPVAQTVTITLDKSVEVFDPDKEENHHQH